MPVILKSRPRLYISLAFTVLLGIILPPPFLEATRLLVAWDSGVLLYLILIGWMMKGSNIDTVRRHAAEDEGKMVISILSIIAAIVSIAAIINEMATAKNLTGLARGEHITLAGITVVLSWCLMQTIFALHYAHEYYFESKGKLNKGLEFPGTPEPDYWDFIYFSFIIGTAAQTADVNITSQRIRRLSTLQSLIVFFFNVMILALMVNIGAGLF